jgi:hypothetical protein
MEVIFHPTYIKHIKIICNCILILEPKLFELNL